MMTMMIIVDDVFSSRDAAAFCLPLPAVAPLPLPPLSPPSSLSPSPVDGVRVGCGVGCDVGCGVSGGAATSQHSILRRAKAEKT